jgi:hypothetical protein
MPSQQPLSIFSLDVRCLPTSVHLFEVNSQLPNRPRRPSKKVRRSLSFHLRLSNSVPLTGDVDLPLCLPSLLCPAHLLPRPTRLDQ